MKTNIKTLGIRNYLTIGAEIATILSLVLAWVMYQDSQKAVTDSDTNVPGFSPIIVFFVIVNVVMFSFLTFTIAKSLFIHFRGKSYCLKKKFKDYVQSESDYVHALKREKREKDICNRTTKALASLNQRTTFDEDIYYMLLYSLFYDAEGDINVVSILDDNEWVDTPEEDEFLKLNLAVADKKVHLNRIFVVEEKDIATKLNTKSIQSFIEADHAYIHLFVVFKEKLSRSIINNIGSGFIEFYNFVVACDIFEDDEIRGTLGFEKDKVDFYHKTYMRLSEFYTPLNQEFVNKHLKTTISMESAPQ